MPNLYYTTCLERLKNKRVQHPSLAHFLDPLIEKICYSDNFPSRNELLIFIQQIRVPDGTTLNDDQVANAMDLLEAWWNGQNYTPLQIIQFNNPNIGLIRARTNQATLHEDSVLTEISITPNPEFDNAQQALLDALFTQKDALDITIPHWTPESFRNEVINAVLPSDTTPLTDVLQVMRQRVMSTVQMGIIAHTLTATARSHGVTTAVANGHIPPIVDAVRIELCDLFSDLDFADNATLASSVSIKIGQLQLRPDSDINTLKKQYLTIINQRLRITPNAVPPRIIHAEHSKLNALVTTILNAYGYGSRDEKPGLTQLNTRSVLVGFPLAGDVIINAADKIKASVETGYIRLQSVKHIDSGTLRIEGYFALPPSIVEEMYNDIKTAKNTHPHLSLQELQKIETYLDPNRGGVHLHFFGPYGAPMVCPDDSMLLTLRPYSASAQLNGDRHEKLSMACEGLRAAGYHPSVFAASLSSATKERLLNIIYMAAQKIASNTCYLQIPKEGGMELSTDDSALHAMARWNGEFMHSKHLLALFHHLAEQIQQFTLTNISLLFDSSSIDTINSAYPFDDLHNDLVQRINEVNAFITPPHHLATIEAKLATNYGELKSKLNNLLEEMAAFKKDFMAYIAKNKYKLPNSTLLANSLGDIILRDQYARADSQNHVYYGHDRLPVNHGIINSARDGKTPRQRTRLQHNPTQLLAEAFLGGVRATLGTPEYHSSLAELRSHPAEAPITPRASRRHDSFAHNPYLPDSYKDSAEEPAGLPIKMNETASSVKFGARK